MDPIVVFLQAVVSGVSIGCIYALVALGFVLIYKATEVVNFAQGELMMVGAFFAYTLVDLGGIPFVPGVLLALLATAAFGVFINRLLLRPLIGSPAFTIVLATVAVSTLIRAVVAMVPGWGVETHRLSNPVAGKVIRLGDLVISAEHLLVIVITILLVALLYLFFSRSRIGIALQATSQNQLAAGYAGINVRRMFGLIWGISAAVAALAGVLLAPMAFVHVNMGYIGLKAFPAAVLGGFGSLPGAVIGGIVIGVIEELAGLYLPEGFKNVAAYIVLLAMLMVRPQGLFGNLEAGPGVAVKFYKKTSYTEDFRLFRDRTMAFWYAVLGLLLLAAPGFVPTYYLSQLVLIGIYAVAGAGLMLLCGFCGQISLGHSAFFAVGAFTTAVLEKHGVPFPLALAAAGLLAAAVGLVIGLPALRLSGMYLAIATLAAAFIVNEAIVRWESVTNGSSGINVPKIRVGGFVADTEPKLYYIVLAVALLVLFAVRNIVRAPLGLAMMAIRDSETAAQSMGVPLMRTKLTAFAISALLTGIAGALYAHKIQFIDPDQFTIFVSIEFLVMIFIGGIGSMHGIVLGAVFIIALPQLVAVAKDHLPAFIAQQTGLQAAVYAIVLLGFILAEPTGLYGIWRRIKHYCAMFPFYRQGSLKRAKSFAKSETW